MKSQSNQGTFAAWLPKCTIETVPTHYYKMSFVIVYSQLNQWFLQLTSSCDKKKPEWMKPSQAKKDIRSCNDRKEEVLNLSQILNPEFLSPRSDKDVLCC